MKFNNIEYLRRLVLLLKIINKIIEKALKSESFKFSWKEILKNLLHLENDPDLTRVVENWARLPEHVKMSILTLMEVSQK